MVDVESKSSAVGRSRRPPPSDSGDSTGAGWPRRLAESFFSRPLLCLLPLIVLVGFGFYQAGNSQREYVSEGVLGVSRQTLLTSLTEIGVGEGFTFESPASVTSRTINELMGTDEFSRLVAESAGLGVASEIPGYQLDGVRRAVGARPTGSNLVAVTASTWNPELSRALADATMTTFIEWVVEGDLSQSATAEDFFNELIGTYEADLEAAREAVEQFVRENPIDEGEIRSAGDAARLARLENDLQLAEARYTDAVASSEDAQLAVAQARIDVDQRLRVIDAPQTPAFPQSVRRDQILSVGVMIVVGSLLSAGVVALGALLNRSVMSPDQIRSRFGLEVLAIVPDARR